MWIPAVISMLCGLYTWHIKKYHFEVCVVVGSGLIIIIFYSGRRNGTCMRLRSYWPFQSALYTFYIPVIYIIYVMWCTCYVFCCTWYVFAVVLKVKKASSSQNRGGLPTIYYIYIWILPITNIGLKTTPGNAWYLVPRLIYCTCTGVIPDA